MYSVVTNAFVFISDCIIPLILWGAIFNSISSLGIFCGSCVDVSWRLRHASCNGVGFYHAVSMCPEVVIIFCSDTPIYRIMWFCCLYKQLAIYSIMIKFWDVTNSVLTFSSQKSSLSSYFKGGKWFVYPS